MGTKKGPGEQIPRDLFRSLYAGQSCRFWWDGVSIVILPPIPASFSLEFWQDDEKEIYFDLFRKPAWISISFASGRKKRAQGNVNYLRPNFIIGSIFQGGSAYFEWQRLKETKGNLLWYNITVLLTNQPQNRSSLICLKNWAENPPCSVGRVYLFFLGSWCLW